MQNTNLKYSFLKKDILSESILKPDMEKYLFIPFEKYFILQKIIIYYD